MKSWAIRGDKFIDGVWIPHVDNRGCTSGGWSKIILSSISATSLSDGREPIIETRSVLSPIHRRSVTKLNLRRSALRSFSKFLAYGKFNYDTRAINAPEPWRKSRFVRREPSLQEFNFSRFWDFLDFSNTLLYTLLPISLQPFKLFEITRIPMAYRFFEFFRFLGCIQFARISKYFKVSASSRFSRLHTCH